MSGTLPLPSLTSPPLESWPHQLASARLQLPSLATGWGAASEPLMCHYAFSLGPPALAQRAGRLFMFEALWVSFLLGLGCPVWMH